MNLKPGCHARVSIWMMIIIIGIPSISSSAPSIASYMLNDNYGGTWSDAEKRPDNPSDTNMCWAAAASNVLDWTGWGPAAGFNNADQIFEHYQNHWTNQGGMMQFGWQWFFDGTNVAQGYDGWAQVDVPGGGGFFPSEDFYGDLFHDNWTSLGWDTAGAMHHVDNYLRSGYGTTLAVYNDTIGHAVTVWGFDYNPNAPDNYYGVWITDSDDDKFSVDPADELKYYDIVYSNNRWYLQNYYGYNDIYIGGVQALAPMSGYQDLQTAHPVPAPGAILLAGIGTSMVGWMRRRRAL